ncbi:unnamed protein product [Macrosiphum euphorbiae]|uniref:Uncharacterized protein n=1 Tax=Macrosiphum euphorbiae TaxID=13131 RepID=A0AAV0XWJ0_9HEMI|nr:unnamed protein product [Macrosiphum euphorbiae]
MDTWTVSKLEEWQMPEHVIVKCKEEGIDKSAFLTLTESMIKELVPMMGLRSKLYNKHVELKIQCENIHDNNLEAV